MGEEKDEQRQWMGLQLERLSVRSDITPASNRCGSPPAQPINNAPPFIIGTSQMRDFSTFQSPAAITAARTETFFRRAWPRPCPAAGLANAGILISAHTQAHGSGETVVPESGTYLSTHTGQKDWCRSTPESAMIPYLITPYMMASRFMFSRQPPNARGIKCKTYTATLTRRLCWAVVLCRIGDPATDIWSSCMVAAVHVAFSARLS
jgi:hypothetical protein